MAAEPTPPNLADMQHWTWVMGRAQQMMMEQGLAATAPEGEVAPPWPIVPGINDPETMARMRDFWTDSLTMWQRMLDPATTATPSEEPADRTRDKRFKADAWRDQPYFDWVRRSYFTIADHLLGSVDAMEGVPEKQKDQMRFAAQGFIDAMSPSNFALTNPEVIEKTIETRGQNLLDGLQNMMADMKKGQMTHVDPNAFEVGRNLATTPGKVVHRTPLYELIQYAPTTDKVLGVPLIIFPPWINRFLYPRPDAGEELHPLVRRSGDHRLHGVVEIGGCVDERRRLGTITSPRRSTRSTPSAMRLACPRSTRSAIASRGTTLAATLALLTARDEADKVASATFFTAQVDFSNAGELQNFVDDDQLKLVAALSPEGYLDGRYMAATFNLLRGRDLIWNYVTNNYLMGKEYAPFDLLHWNGDTTNLPAKWHLGYLTDLYRDNRLAMPGSMVVDGTPIDLTTVKTPSYIQAGREDHIAPADSVWKITDLFQGPLKFVLAGSGAYRGRRQPARRAEIPILDQRRRCRDARRFRRGRDRDEGELVARLARLAAGTRRQDRAREKGARARQG